MTTEQAPPARRVKNTDPSIHAMCTYAPTKCGVILKEMVDAFDRQHPGKQASKFVGRFFAKADEMLDLVSRRYVELDTKRKKTNLLTAQETGGFKEHLVRNLATDLHYSIDGLPNEIGEMMKTVLKERINIRKTKLGVAPPKRGINYEVWDLKEWSLSEPVQKARARFVKRLSKYRTKYAWVDTRAPRWVNRDDDKKDDDTPPHNAAVVSGMPRAD